MDQECWVLLLAVAETHLNNLKRIVMHQITSCIQNKQFFLLFSSCILHALISAFQYSPCISYDSPHRLQTTEFLVFFVALFNQKCRKVEEQIYIYEMMLVLIVEYQFFLLAQLFFHIFHFLCTIFCCAKSRAERWLYTYLARIETSNGFMHLP